MKYHQPQTDRKPIDKRTRRQMARTDKRSFLNSEALALWLAGHNAAAGPGITASVEEWLAMIRGPGKSALFVTERGVPVSTLKISRAPAYVRFLRRFRRAPAYD